MYDCILEQECLYLISEHIWQSSHMCVLVDWQKQSTTSSYFAPSSPFQPLVEPISLLCHLIVPFNLFQSSDYHLCKETFSEAKFLLHFTEGILAVSWHYCDADPKLSYFIHPSFNFYQSTIKFNSPLPHSKNINQK